jgi:hypothetical protein
MTYRKESRFRMFLAALSSAYHRPLGDIRPCRAGASLLREVCRP